MSDNQYEYLKRQYYLATHMELTEENVIRVLEELQPYIEADGGWLEFVEIEHETNFVKVRLGGACSTCAMSAITFLFTLGSGSVATVRHKGVAKDFAAKPKELSEDYKYTVANK